MSEGQRKKGCEEGRRQGNTGDVSEGEGVEGHKNKIEIGAGGRGRFTYVT